MDVTRSADRMDMTSVVPGRSHREEGDHAVYPAIRRRKFSDLASVRPGLPDTALSRCEGGHFRKVPKRNARPFRWHAPILWGVVLPFSRGPRLVPASINLAIAVSFATGRGALMTVRPLTQPANASSTTARNASGASKWGKCAQASNHTSRLPRGASSPSKNLCASAAGAAASSRPWTTVTGTSSRESRALSEKWWSSPSTRAWVSCMPRSAAIAWRNEYSGERSSRKSNCRKSPRKLAPPAMPPKLETHLTRVMKRSAVSWGGAPMRSSSRSARRCPRRTASSRANCHAKASLAAISTSGPTARTRRTRLPAARPRASQGSHRGRTRRRRGGEPRAVRRSRPPSRPRRRPGRRGRAARSGSDRTRVRCRADPNTRRETRARGAAAAPGRPLRESSGSQARPEPAATPARPPGLG